MKKFIAIFILSLFALQTNVFAQSETIITGRMSGMSVQDAWITVDVGKPITERFSNFLRNIVSRDKVKNYDQYVFSISGTTNLWDKNGNSLEMQNLAIGDKVVAKGIMLHSENGYYFAEGMDMVFEKQRTFFQAIQDAIVDRKEQPQSSSMDFSSLNVMSGSQNRFSLQTSQEEDKCVGEGEAVLTSPLFVSGSFESMCCEGLTLCDPGENKIINKGGVNYIVKGICRRHCDVPADNSGSDIYKIYSPWDLIKSFASDALKNSQGPNLPKLPVPSIQTECRIDYDCWQKYMNERDFFEYACAGGFCIRDKRRSDPRSSQRDAIDARLGSSGTCKIDLDCVSDGQVCISKEQLSTHRNILNVFNLWTFKNDPNCSCKNGVCVGVGGMRTDFPGMNRMECGDELAEVCGVDGKNYRNPCEILKANVDIRHYGACVDPSKTDPKKDEGGVGEIRPLPGDDPMFCGHSGECFWCNDACFTKTMIEEMGMTCDPNKKMPSDMTCICDSRTKMCNVFPKLGVPAQPPPTTIPGRTNIPDNICMTDRDCTFCGSQCFTSSIVQKMSSAGNNCDISLKPKNAVCLCRMGTCVVEYTSIPQTPTSTVGVPVPPVTVAPSPSGPAKITESNIPGFCGVQTGGYCSNDAGCMVGGCSGNVCQSKNEVPVVTICDWKECYQVPSRTYCGCVNNKCMWYQSQTPTSSSTTTTTMPQPPTQSPPTLLPPPTNGGGIVAPPPDDHICLFVMMCLNGKIHTADCGEAGTKCYQFRDLGNGNCSCY